MQMPMSTGHALPRNVVTALVMVLSVDANPVVTSGAELIVQRSPSHRRTQPAFPNGFPYALEGQSP